MNDMLLILNRTLEVVDTISCGGDFTKVTQFFDDEYKQDLTSGAEIFSFSTTADSTESQHLNVGNYIIFKDGKHYKLFNIINVEEVHDKTFIKNVYCEMAGIELLNQQVRPMKVNGTNLRKFMEAILQQSDWHLGMVDAGFIEIFDFEITESKSIYELIQEYAIGKYGAEIRYRVEVNHGRVTEKFIDVFKTRGKDLGVRFEYSSNIEVISRKIDVSELATALRGEGKNGITFAEVDAPDKPMNQDFLADENAYKQWNIKGTHLLGISKHDTDSPQELLKLTREDLATRSIPKVKYEIKVDLLGTEVNVGDVVSIVDHEFNPPLYLTARVSQLSKHKSDPSKDEVLLSNFKEIKSNITEEMRQLASQLEGYVDNQFPIGGDKIQDGAINGDKLENGQIIKGTHIFANSITADHMKADSIDAEKIKAESIETKHLKADTIEGKHIKAETIEAGNIKAGTITGDQIHANTVTGDHIQANTITGGNIQAGSITAGSGIIAEGAIGNAEISELDAAKLKAGTIDTSKVDVAGPNGNLTMKGNRLQVFEGVGNEKVERVSLGDVNNDGTAYGLRVRGKDGQTVLYDENGVYSEGITDGAINNEHISGEANIEGYKLDINSVVREINGSTEQITGTKIQIGDASLDLELSKINNTVTEDGKKIAKNTADITTNTNQIKLKLDSQTYTTDMEGVNSTLEKNTSEISSLKDQIKLKVEQTNIDTAKSEAIKQSKDYSDKKVDDLQIGTRNLLLRTKLFEEQWHLGVGGVSDGVEKGYKSICVKRTDYVSGNPRAQSTHATNKKLPKGTPVILTGYYYLDNSVPLSNNTNNNNICMRIYDNATSSYADLCAIAFDATKINQWIKFEAKGIIPYDDVKDMHCVISIQQNGFVKVSKPKFEVGTKASDYTEAPEDTENAINKVDKRVTDTNQQVSQISISLGEVKTTVGKIQTTQEEIDGKVTNLTTWKTEAEQKITEEAITNTVKKSFYTKGDIDGKGYQTSSEVQQTVDGLQVKIQQSGGYNLLYNSAYANCKYEKWFFVNGAEYWGDLSYFKEKGDMIIKNSNSTRGHFGMVGNIEVKPGGVYTASLSATKEGNVKGGSIYLDFYKEDGTFLRSTATPLKFDGKRNSYKIEIPNDVNINHMRFYIAHDGSTSTAGGFLIKINKPCLVEGDIILGWSPHPSEIYDGITSIDGDGVLVEMKDGQGVQGSARLGYQGVEVFDSKGNRKAWFGDNDTAYIERLKVDRLENDYVIQWNGGRPTNLYVAPSATGDGTGRDMNNKSNSVNNALNWIWKKYGAYSWRQDLYVYIDGGVYYEDVYVGGWIGTGTVQLVFNHNASLYGTITVEENTCPVALRGSRTGWGDNNGCIIYAPDTAITVRHSMCLVEGFRSRPNCYPNYGGTFTRATWGSRVMVSNCDLVKYWHVAFAADASLVHFGDNRGDVKYIAQNPSWSTYYLLATYRPIPDSGTEFSGEWNCNVVHRAGDRHNSVWIPKDTPQPPPTPTYQWFENSFSLYNLRTVPEGSGSGTTGRNGEWGQGKWSSYKPHHGFADMGNNPANWCSGGRNFTVTLIMTRLNTSHGYAGDVPKPKIKEPNGNYWNSNTGFARGATKSIQLPSSIANAIASGSMKTLEMWSTTTDDYSFYNNVSIKIRCEKQV